MPDEGRCSACQQARTLLSASACAGCTGLPGCWWPHCGLLCLQPAARAPCRLAPRHVHLRPCLHLQPWQQSACHLRAGSSPSDHGSAQPAHRSRTLHCWQSSHCRAQGSQALGCTAGQLRCWLYRAMQPGRVSCAWHCTSAWIFSPASWCSRCGHYSCKSRAALVTAVRLRPARAWLSARTAVQSMSECVLQPSLSES